MLVPMDEYRVKLINDLVFAASQDEVKSLINASIRVLEENKVNSHIISRFIERIINELELFNPMKKDAWQWSNIKLARILFKRLRGQLNTPAV